MQVAMNSLLLLCLVGFGLSAPIEQTTHLEEQEVLAWLKHYEFYLGKLDIPADEVADALLEPLMIMKADNGITPVNGEVTADVLEIVRAPRCGEKEGNSSRRKRWARLGSHVWNEMPVTIKFKNYLTEDVSKSEQIAVLKECATLWARDSGLSFKILSSGVADVEIEYQYLDGELKTVGTALSPTPWDRNRPSYLRLDTSESWKARKSSSRGKVSLKWAMCHELGHNLGLGHTNERDAFMFGSGIGQDETNLHNDDRTGIQALYGGPNGKIIIEDGSSPITPQPRVTSKPTSRRPIRFTTTTEAPTTTNRVQRTTKREQIKFETTTRSRYRYRQRYSRPTQRFNYWKYAQSPYYYYRRF